MASLPSYLISAKPVPWTARSPWYKTIAPTYAGIMLWFVFWQSIPAGTGTPGGVLSAGMGPAFLGLIIGAVICHFLFYMAPAMLGVKTGLPLYVIGTSTYGARGGLLMPGFLMGLLQFGWLGVNAFAVGTILCKCFNLDGTVPGMAHGAIATVFAVVAALVGLKGIQYVARVATYLPLIPIAVLIMLLAMTFGGLKGYYQNIDVVVSAQPQAEKQQAIERAASDTEVDMETGAPQHVSWEDAEKIVSGNRWAAALQRWGVLSVLVIYVVGFFATAGAAGTDIAANSRNEEDVHIGGVAGIIMPTVLTGWAALLIVAGAYGGEMVQPEHMGNLNPVDLMPDILGKDVANWAMIGLAISAFPGACFSAFIAANSFKTTMPRINPFISVGIGTLASVYLAASGLANDVVSIFVVIGASFGPVCGAMLADFWLSGLKWSGPRMGFNPAGWISWIVGFAVGAFNLLANSAVEKEWSWAFDLFPSLAEIKDIVPVPPVSAFVVGFVLYLVLSAIGVRTKTYDQAQRAG